MIPTQRKRGRGRGSTRDVLPPQKRRKTPYEIRLEEEQRRQALPIAIPESPLFHQLLAFERRLDATITRKMFDIHEVLPKPIKIEKQLFICIYNTYANQHPYYHTEHPLSELSVADPPSWTLHIEGLIKGDESPHVQSKRRFTSFLRKAFIQIQDGPNKPPHIVEWSHDQSAAGPGVYSALAASATDQHSVASHQVSPPPTVGVAQDYDGFEIKHIGTEPANVKIILHLDHLPPQYKLSPQLAELLNLHTESKQRVLIALWQYVRSNRLQDPNDSYLVRCNDKLRALFGVDEIRFSQLSIAMGEHLGPPDPLEFDYKVKLHGDPKSFAEVYEVKVNTENPQAAVTSEVALHTSALRKEAAQLDEQLKATAERLRKLREHRNFFREFSNQPVEFLERLIQIQLRDYKIATIPVTDIDEAITGTRYVPEADRHADYYYNPFIYEAISTYFRDSEEAAAGSASGTTAQEQKNS